MLTFYNLELHVIAFNYRHLILYKNLNNILLTAVKYTDQYKRSSNQENFLSN